MDSAPTIRMLESKGRKSARRRCVEGLEGRTPMTHATALNSPVLAARRRRPRSRFASGAWSATVSLMAATAEHFAAATDRTAREEERLARAAAAGDGAAFAELYERYERRAYNLAYRVTGSAETAADATQDAFVNVMRRLPEIGDREQLNFGSYLLTATRNACYDLMRKQQRAQPTDQIPESATPVGAGGGAHLDPGDPDEDPDRNVLVQAQQEEIREANARLPDRQREALALFELGDMSYDEVGEIMGMKRNAVAQLISRARISLRDELRGTALASIAAATPECERALPLIALDDDRQLDVASDDAIWLAGHVAGCNTCRLSREAMEEAGRSYRAWIPVAAAPLLFRETMAKAAEAVGADWSDVIAEREAARAGAENGGGGDGLSGSQVRAPRGPARASPPPGRRLSPPWLPPPAAPAGGRCSSPRGSRRRSCWSAASRSPAATTRPASQDSITPAADVATTPFPTRSPRPRQEGREEEPGRGRRPPDGAQRPATGAPRSEQPEPGRPGQQQRGGGSNGDETGGGNQPQTPRRRRRRRPPHLRRPRRRPSRRRSSIDPPTDPGGGPPTNCRPGATC